MYFGGVHKDLIEQFKFKFYNMRLLYSDSYDKKI